MPGRCFVQKKYSFSGISIRFHDTYDIYNKMEVTNNPATNYRTERDAIVGTL